MKKDELQKIREKSKAEIFDELKLLKDKLRQLRLDVGNGKVKNINEIRKNKKIIAVMNTVLNEK